MSSIIKKETNLVKDNSSEDYILGTLLYTPLFYAKNERAVEIKVYGPNETYPSMKIFRMIIRCVDLPTTPSGQKEIAFQDEVNILKKDGMDHNHRWQVNFSIFVDKETYSYKSIYEKPAGLTHMSDSLNVFKKLSKEKGSKLYAGDWRFESDGENWIPINVNSANILTVNSLPI